MKLTEAIQVYKADIRSPHPLSTEAHVQIHRALQEHPLLLDILEERVRQVEAEGYTPNHDDHHHYFGDLADAAAACAFAASCPEGFPDGHPPSAWPWFQQSWKHKGQDRMLIIAGALVLAERERLYRCGLAPKGESRSLRSIPVSEALQDEAQEGGE